LVLLSCSDSGDDVIPVLAGDYEGTFTVKYLDGTSYSNPATISFNEGNKYESTDGNNYVPAAGTGTYKIEGSFVKFNEPNYWTANFDWNLVLSGEYRVSSNGDSLTLVKAIDNLGTYSYELVRKQIN
jgi:hypothetical protein